MNRDVLRARLLRSKFRSRFHLKEKEFDYIDKKGLDVIERHARDFVKLRLAPKVLLNDGRQTPMKGHPVFIAQHATATCCRECLYKWHGIGRNRELSLEEQEYIVMILMWWIKSEYDDYLGKMLH